jgi:general secretion pathway protein M
VIETLSLRQRRMLALGILLLALATLFGISVWPILLANRHYQETISSLESRLRKLERAAAIGETLEPKYEMLKRLQNADVQELRSTSPAVAAAELQRLVKRIAVARNAQVLSAQNLTAHQEAGFDRISLKVRMRGELESIVQAFYDLETGEPFVFLDNVSIRASRGRRVRGRVAPQQTLDIDMEVIGYMAHSS